MCPRQRRDLYKSVPVHTDPRVYTAAVEESPRNMRRPEILARDGELSGDPSSVAEPSAPTFAPVPAPISAPVF